MGCPAYLSCSFASCRVSEQQERAALQGLRVAAGQEQGSRACPVALIRAALSQQLPDKSAKARQPSSQAGNSSPWVGTWSGSCTAQLQSGPEFNSASHHCPRFSRGDPAKAAHRAHTACFTVSHPRVQLHIALLLLGTQNPCWGRECCRACWCTPAQESSSSSYQEW